MSTFKKQFSIELPILGLTIVCILYGIYVQGLDAACRNGVLKLENSWCAHTAHTQEVANKQYEAKMAEQRELGGDAALGKYATIENAE